MSQNDLETLTYHAMLVIWGQFAHCIGLPAPFRAVKLHQKTVQHSPQTKVLEFLVSMLAGMEHLQDISRSAHPLDQDLAVAKAWGQPSWADYSGISRTLAGLTQAEAEQIAAGAAELWSPEVRWRSDRPACLEHQQYLPGSGLRAYGRRAAAWLSGGHGEYAQPWLRSFLAFGGAAPWRHDFLHTS